MVQPQCTEDVGISAPSIAAQSDDIDWASDSDEWFDRWYNYGPEAVDCE